MAGRVQAWALDCSYLPNPGTVAVNSKMMQIQAIATWLYCARVVTIGDIVYDLVIIWVFSYLTPSDIMVGTCGSWSKLSKPCIRDAAGAHSSRSTCQTTVKLAGKWVM